MGNTQSNSVKDWNSICNHVVIYRGFHYDPIKIAINRIKKTNTELYTWVGVKNLETGEHTIILKLLHSAN